MWCIFFSFSECVIEPSHEVCNGLEKPGVSFSYLVSFFISCMQNSFMHDFSFFYSPLLQLALRARGALARPSLFHAPYLGLRIWGLAFQISGNRGCSPRSARPPLSFFMHHIWVWEFWGLAFQISGNCSRARYRSELDDIYQLQIALNSFPCILSWFVYCAYSLVNINISFSPFFWRFGKP